MHESIYILYVNDIYHDSTWKHLRQPCANLAPSLCFAGFPCVTPHNELVKSYKSVGCVPPRLKFLFRTFDRQSYIYAFFFRCISYDYIQYAPPCPSRFFQAFFCTLLVLQLFTCSLTLGKFLGQPTVGQVLMERG